MKILYDHQFFPILRFSGISRYYFELAKHLVKRSDCDVSIFMGWHINEFAFNLIAKGTEHFFGMRRPIFHGSERIFSHLNNVGLSVFSSLYKADIYHQTYYSYLLPNFRGRRIVTLYDMIYFLFPQCFDEKDKIRDHTRKSVEMADGIIAISENSKNDLMRILNVPAEKIRVIYLANSLTNIPDPENPVKSPYILFVGQRFHWKNFITLLRAYAHSQMLHENYKLVCFGGWEWTHEEKEILNRPELQNRIVKTSGPDELLATFYSHASAFIYPSLYEGFGLPILEAMHYGCPVITSNAGSIPEIAGDAVLYFEPENIEMLQNQIVNCLDDSKLRDDLSKRGIRQEAKYSWQKCADETYAFYSHILQN